MIKISWYKYAIISMIIAAVFGITLGMGTTCLIPVSFAVLGCSAVVFLFKSNNYETNFSTENI